MLHLNNSQSPDRIDAPGFVGIARGSSKPIAASSGRPSL